MTLPDALAARLDGLPRDEAWKYTSLSPLTAALGACWWAPASTGDAAVASPARMSISDAVDLEREVALPAGVTRAPLAGALSEAEAFTAALNAAFADAGSSLSIEGSVPRLLLLDHGAVDGTCYRRHSVEVARGAQATLIELIHGESVGLSSHDCRIVLREGAQLTHYRLQLCAARRFHLAHLAVEQQRGSAYRLHAVELGAALSRLDLHVALAEPGADCDLRGLFVLNGRQHVDHQLTIRHLAPRARSRVACRTVLDGRAHAVFNGKVVVARGAEKSDSAQRNNNLLLSSRAEIDSKPELEIYNDDVQCAHGATIGQLDAEQLFYLRSRGVEEALAREMLVGAFITSMVEGIAVPELRRQIEQRVAEKMNGRGMA